MRLHRADGARLYVNHEERGHFVESARRAQPEARLLALTLLLSGCRLSEALALRGQSVQVEAGVLSIQTLKTRRAQPIREVPIPKWLAKALVASESMPEELLWSSAGVPLNRSQAYRWIKAIMAEAGISGPQACPKGLRHGFGVHALTSGVPLNMLQKWMGHASMSTTAIYANATGPEERVIAERMWTEV